MTQQINISDEVYNAIVAKHGDVSAFLELLAKEALVDPSFEPFTPSERAASETILARGEEDLAAGRTQDMRDALLDMGKRRGYSLDQ